MTGARDSDEVMVDDFDAWYRELRPRLATALAAWCGDANVAADAVDEAFVRACERWERVRRLDAPAGWVWRTATNVARRTMRRHRIEARSLHRHAAGRATEVGGPGPEDLDLVDALRRLTERQRTVVVLHHVADLTHAEVGAALGIATGTVAATLHQAKARLAAHLTERIAPLTAPEPTPDPAPEPAPGPSPAGHPRPDGATS